MHVRRLELLTNFGKIRHVHSVLFALAVGNLDSLKEPRRVELGNKSTAIFVFSICISREDIRDKGIGVADGCNGLKEELNDQFLAIIIEPF